MNMVQASGEMPLHCGICPKKPNFSDVSHLLTHIASKGHLSNYFKTQVRAPHDPVAGQEIQSYDTWYNLWNVQDLMRQRMEQKEKKKGGSTNTPRRSFTATSGSTRNTPSIASTGSTVRRPNGLRENVLDPLLDRRVKEEPFSRSGTPVASPYHSNAFGRTYGPPILLGQDWPIPYVGSVYTSTASSIKQEELGDSNDSYADDESVAEIESRRRLRSNNRRKPSISYESIPSYDDDQEAGETIVDSSRMKGVYWEGMAMFDSATTEMRRKRNQKKSTSVLDQLMATSVTIQPDELIFDANWNHRKTRVITGNPDESEDGESVLSGETTPEPDVPVKKKITRRPRQPLAERNVNSGRVLRRRGAPSQVARGLRSSNASSFDDQGDDDLTYGRSKPKKRSGLSIHRDNSGPEITFNEPSSFGLLTAGLGAGFRNPYHHAQQQGHPGFHHDQHNLHRPTFDSGHPRLPPFGTFRPALSNIGSFGSLNGQVLFPQHGFAAMNGHHTIPTFETQYGPQQYRMGMPSFEHGTDNLPVGYNIHHEGYGAGTQDGIVPNNQAANAHNGPGVTSVNPLFLSSQQAGSDDEEDEEEEDDDATVSGPPSECEK